MSEMILTLDELINKLTLIRDEEPERGSDLISIYDLRTGYRVMLQGLDDSIEGCIDFNVELDL